MMIFCIIISDMDLSELKKLQVEELKILKEFIRVCDELSIRYSVAYGTALGAVRHAGFIPWDDDIDIIMLRKDFNRFIKEAPPLLPPHLSIQSVTTDKDYYVMHAKLRNDNTTYLEPDWQNRKGSQGVFIDLFPYDYIPAPGVKRKIIEWKRRFWQNLISIPLCSISNGGAKQKMKNFMRPLMNMIDPTRNRAARCWQDCAEQVSQSAFVCDHEVWEYIYQAEWFENTVKMPFEDIMVAVPVGYHEYLTIRYGDYMQLPPPEARTPRHFGGIIDLERPYTHYIKK